MCSDVAIPQGINLLLGHLPRASAAGEARLVVTRRNAQKAHHMILFGL